MNNKDRHITNITIHSAVWLMLFLSPLMFLNRGEGFNIEKYAMLLVVPLSLMVVFYINYLWIAPKYFITGDRQKFWIINIVSIVIVALILHSWMKYNHGMMMEVDKPGPPPRHHPLAIFFILRDIFNLSISSAIATMLIISEKWHHSEDARIVAEAARKDAELKNLRNQINPHFLLNTLNNIYALTAFDSNKAQHAIQELSEMLRHVLYDNQQPFVMLTDEVQFIGNYVNLMKIRLSSNVTVNVNFHLPTPCTKKIAPLIFISLIENAFKHGISPAVPSFIHINISADKDCIICDIENSNYPKAQADRSGHGIGLEQVEERLNLSYPEQFKWTKGINEDGKIYKSKIIIYDSKLCNYR